MSEATVARGSARQRVLDAALDLFAEHGISGTSLQMIADRIGVTKAAVYHQFSAKDDIALAVMAGAFTALDTLTETVAAAPAAERDDLVIDGLVAMMIDQRHIMSALYRDPEMDRLVNEHREHSETRRRFDELINPPGAAGALQRRLAWSVIGAGFTRAIVDPQFADVSDEELAGELRTLARRVLG